MGDNVFLHIDRQTHPQGNDFYVYDALIMVTGAYIYQHIIGFGKLKNVLAYFGKYSMDMFLIHTFFYK